MLKFNFLVKKGENRNMQGAVIENIYQRTSNYQIKDSKINKISDRIIASFMAHCLFHSLKKVAKKMDYSNFIEKNPDICNGEAVIKGTRIKPITIYNYWVANQKKYEDMDLYFEDVKKAYPALNDEKTLYAWLYCIRKMSLKQLFK